MLTLVATPIGNLEEVSPRVSKALRFAQIVLCEDTRVAKKLFHLLDKRHHLHTDLTQKQFIAFHLYNENDFFDRHNIDFDKSVIYICDAGTPCISDPGALLVQHCIDKGIAYDVVGVNSAFLQAFVMSGFLCTTFCFQGFLPQKGQARQKALEDIMCNQQVQILYEAPQRIKQLLQAIDALDPKRLVFAVKELTKQYQKAFKGTPTQLLKTLEDCSIKGEWAVVISGFEGVSSSSGSIDVLDILELDLPKKQKAKLLHKIDNRPIKTWYDELQNQP